MLRLLIVVLTVFGQTPESATPIDVATVTVGPVALAAQSPASASIDHLGDRGVAAGAILSADSEGRLTLRDQRKRKLSVPDVKGAMMPAWSSDGTRMSATVTSRD